MKKIITFVLALVMCLPLALVGVGCGKKTSGKAAGLYNGDWEMKKSWSQIVEQYSSAFASNGSKIVDAGEYESCFDSDGLDGNLIIDKSVKDLSEDYIFYGCYKLNSVWIPSSVEKGLGEYCFCDCTSLKYIVIDSKSVYLGLKSSQFNNCYHLDCIYVNENMENELKQSVGWLDESGEFTRTKGSDEFSNYYKYVKNS